MQLNLIAIIAVSISFGIVAFNTILPLVRRRPIIFSNKMLLIFVSGVGFSFLLSGYYILLVAMIVAVAFLFLTRLWIMVGIKDEDLIAALERTIKGTLVKAQLNLWKLVVEFAEPPGSMNFYQKLPFNIKICFPHLPSTPKIKLFQGVLKKIIDNYHIHI